MKRMTSSGSVYSNLDQFFRQHWFRYTSFDGFWWHFKNSRDYPRADFWVRLKQTSNPDGWLYCVKGRNVGAKWNS
jgi:hypothetical protein